MEKREYSCTTGGNVNWYSHYGEQYGNTLKTRNKSTIRTRNPTTGHVPCYYYYFSHSVVSDSLRPHELQHARPPCPSPIPGVHSNSHASSQWCYLAISSSVIPFSSCPQSLPASESFPMSQLFAWGGRSTRVSALASFLPKKTQDWSPLEWIGWISLQSNELSRVLPTPQFKSINSLALSLIHSPTLTSIHEQKTIALTRRTFVDKVMSLLLNMLSRLDITFLLRTKHLLISWLQSPSAVILETRKIKSDTVSTISPSISHEVMGPDAMILVFWMLSFKPTFSLSFHFHQEAL